MKQVKEIKELLKGLEVVGVAGVKIAADGKVSIEDLAHIVALAKQIDVLSAAVAGLGEIDDELKDLDQAEIIELVGAVFALVKAIKEAK
jgi:hypothetical protein